MNKQNYFYIRPCLFFLAALYVAFACISPSFGGDNTVVLKAGYGFSGVAKNGCWTPVYVDVEFTPDNPSKTLDGEIRIYTWSTNVPARRYYYSRPLTMGPGKKRVHVYVVPFYATAPYGKPQFQVSYFDKKSGKDIASCNIEITNTSDAFLDISRRLFVFLGKERRRSLRMLKTFPAFPVWEIMDGDVPDWAALASEITKEPCAPPVLKLVAMHLDENEKSAALRIANGTSENLKHDRNVLRAALNRILSDLPSIQRSDVWREYPELRNRWARLRARDWDWLRSNNWGHDADLPPGLIGRLALQAVLGDLILEQKKIEPLPDVAEAFLPCKYAPDSWVGYQSAYVVTCSRGDLLALSEVQRKALRDWVWQGGRLLVFVDADSNISDAGALKDILPVELVGSAMIDLHEKSADHQDLKDEFVKLSSGAWRLLGKYSGAALPKEKVAFSRMKPLGGNVISGSSDFPLVVRASIGSGTVTVAAFGLFSHELASFRGRLSIFGRLSGSLFEAADAAHFDSIAAGKTSASLWQHRAQYEATALDSIFDYLYSEPESNTVGLWVIILFLGLYVVLAGPVDYYILNRLGRLRLAWLTYLAWVGIFVSVAVVGGRAIRGSDSILREFVVSDVVASQRISCERDFCALFSANEKKYDIMFERHAYACAADQRADAFGTFGRRSARRRLNQEFQFSEQVFPDAGAQSIVQAKNHALLSSVPIHQWSLAAVTAESIDDAYPLLSGGFEYAGHTLSGKIKPLQDIDSAILVGRHGVYAFGRMKKDTDYPAPKKFEPLPVFLSGISGDASAIDSLYDDKEDNGTLAAADIIYASLRRLCAGWKYRNEIDLCQHSPVNMRGIVELSDEAASGNGGFTGASIEQILEHISDQELSASDLLADRYIPDLSGVVRRGGLVLFGLVKDFAGGAKIEANGILRHRVSMVRIVFPPADKAEGEKLTGDELYKSDYMSGILMGGGKQ